MPFKGYCALSEEVNVSDKDVYIISLNCKKYVLKNNIRVIELLCNFVPSIGAIVVLLLLLFSIYTDIKCLSWVAFAFYLSLVAYTSPFLIK